MIEVELLTDKGDLLTRVSIPQSAQPPEIVIWYGSRYFQLREDGRYWEARAVIGQPVEFARML